MIRTRSILGAVSNLFMWAAPPFATVAVFICYQLVGHEMNQSSLPALFTALMLFNNLRFPLMIFPWLLTMYGDAKVSMGRLQAFLLREEVPDDGTRDYTEEDGVALRISGGHFQWQATPKQGGDTTSETSGKPSTDTAGDADDDEPPTLRGICISDGIGKLCTFFTSAWGSFKKRLVLVVFLFVGAMLALYGNSAQELLAAEVLLSYMFSAAFVLAAVAFAVVKQQRPKLEERVKALAKDDLQADFKVALHMTIPRGQVAMVIGSVGCGKSSVLQAILGEMQKTSGEVKFAKGTRISYCSQQAWLMNASLKQNITFVSPLDEKRYQRVLDLVSLRQDLAELPMGDSTEIGERGINLSGGVHQTISRAEC